MAGRLSRVKNIRDPKNRTAAAQELLVAMEAEFQTKVDEARQVRDEGARAMLKAGYKQADVARLTNLSRNAISKRFRDVPKARG